jgi:hypothetical protein
MMEIFELMDLSQFVQVSLMVLQNLRILLLKTENLLMMQQNLFSVILELRML